MTYPGPNNYHPDHPNYSSSNELNDKKIEEQTARLLETGIYPSEKPVPIYKRGSFQAKPTYNQENFYYSPSSDTNQQTFDSNHSNFEQETPKQFNQDSEINSFSNYQRNYSSSRFNSNFPQNITKRNSKSSRRDSFSPLIPNYANTLDLQSQFQWFDSVNSMNENFPHYYDFPDSKISNLDIFPDEDLTDFPNENYSQNNFYKNRNREFLFNNNHSAHNKVHKMATSRASLNMPEQKDYYFTEGVRYENIEEVSDRSCTCSKTECLKLYCECFSKGFTCNYMCRCANCKNNENFPEERKNAIGFISGKNKSAFGLGSVKGCKCKKTNCTKKYCECYSHGKACNESCSCTNCDNH